ncbi:galectin-2-like [Pristis pectinata]|uniref:galectin-2-like n=1 Tax=Pristis pectinata TaxID=685728 RepID=UPI00223E76BF|nr:galectin-2-like [Pristis pectinata]
MPLEIRNIEMKVGDTLKIKGKISDDANRFAVNLGSSSDNIGLHFNPRFQDEVDGAVIVCNSKCDDSWDSEQRESNFPYSKGEKFKLRITLKEDSFEIKLHDDSTIEFPNRMSLGTVNFVSVDGDFKLVSFRCN